MLLEALATQRNSIASYIMGHTCVGPVPPPTLLTGVRLMQCSQGRRINQNSAAAQ